MTIILISYWSTWWFEGLQGFKRGRPLSSSHQVILNFGSLSAICILRSSARLEGIFLPTTHVLGGGSHILCESCVESESLPCSVFSVPAQIWEFLRADSGSVIFCTNKKHNNIKYYLKFPRSLFTWQPAQKLRLCCVTLLVPSGIDVWSTTLFRCASIS